ncbi:ATP-binding protein [Ideonella sp.]|uniref:ATP-binding protein n=1 Tax=Ideonella sp. TaxID=1929293 RepID=UPI0035AE3ED9
MESRLFPSLPPAWRLLALTLLLAVLYHGGALLGLALAHGPLRIAPVWPPAGLALAAFMLAGWRALPGLALGAVLTHWLDYFGPQHGWTAAALGGAVLLAGGSLAQAGLAAWWTREVVGRAEEQPVRQPATFAAIVALTCVLGATVGTATLHAFGGTPLGEWLANALTWWVGDATGTLVLTPLLLLLLHPALRHRRVASQAFPIICLGLGGTLFATFTASVMERDLQAERFRSDATRLALVLQHQLDIAVRDLEVLQRLAERVDTSGDEFRAVSRPMLRRSPWQQHVAWLPRVPAAGRAAHEAAQGGLPLRELSPRDTVVTAGPRPEYFPVAWTDPESGFESLVGLDQLADPLRAPAIETVRRTGRIAASLPMHAVSQSVSGRYVQVLYAPVPADAGGPMQGLVASTLDVEVLLQTAMDQLGFQGHDLLLRDADAPAAHALHWGDGLAMRVLAPAEQEVAAATLSSGVHHDATVRVADRQWALRLQPAWARAGPRPGWLQAVMLGAGLSLTALLAGFMIARRRHDLLVAGQQQQLEAQVAARTQDLARSNASLREAQAHAEAASRAKSLFLANMSHEIRTPLNAVLGFTQVLIGDASVPAPARQRLQVILSAGQRLLGLINDVLDLAKIESGRLALRPSPFDLHGELAEIGALFADRAAAKGLALQVDLQGLPQPCVVEADRQKLGQVVINLLGNAVKFTEHGSVALVARREGDDVRIEVADSGPGLDDAERERLFAPFSQGEAGRDKGGTGLGLALSREIVRSMGGELGLAGRPGQGTRAWLHLPLPLRDPSALPPAEPATLGRLAAGSRCRALVVEDDTASRELLAGVLADIGCQVVTADDGQAGLAACRAATSLNEGFDIVFTDIRMPRMSGLDMLRALRADPGTAAWPVVAVTASSLEHERRFYLEAGFSDYVAKPYVLPEIARLLQRHGGARLDDADVPAAGAPSAPAATEAPALPLDAAGRALLQALRAAAADGDAPAARAALAGLPAGLPPAAQRTAWEALLRRYDLQALERAVQAWLDEAPAGA